jgi:Ni/Fe-hydrogenase subunit HybB-like protein
LTAIAHFLLPFVVLLVPRLRRSRRGLIATTTLLVVMAVIRGWWLVLPAHESGIGWIDIAAVLAFGGISIGLMLRGPSLRWRMTHA